jgi:uncharacterized protein (DUF2147 family)
MMKTVSVLFEMMALLAPVGAACAQGTAPAAAEKIDLEILKGAWVRPDGGYTIAIKSIGPDGKLDAMYYNPNPLPFARARAVQEGATLRVYLELQAGGYAGSSYELSYAPASNRLWGVYYQAVAKQKFDVYFVRK